MAPISLFFFLLNLLDLSAANRNLIDVACAETRHVDLCIRMLLADPRTKSCADLPCVTRAGVVHAVKIASDTRMRAHIFLREDPMQEHVVPLHRCEEAYVNAMMYLDQAIGRLDGGDCEGAEESVGKVRRQARLCEEAFAEHPNPMTPYNGMFGDVLDVAFDLVVLIDSRVYASTLDPDICRAILYGLFGDE